MKACRRLCCCCSLIIQIFYFLIQNGVTSPPGSTMSAQQDVQESGWESEITIIREVVPQMDDIVIRSVLEEKRGDKQAAIDALLSMNVSQLSILYCIFF